MTILKSAMAVALGSALLFPGVAQAQNKYFDELNGQWTVKLDGQAMEENALTESYPQLKGVRLRFLGKEISDEVVVLRSVKGSDGEYTLTLKAGDATGIVGNLNGDSSDPDEVLIELKTKGQKTRNPKDDSMSGTFRGKTIELVRDLRAKPPIEIKLPGDRPWVRFMQEVLIPKTAEDRESFHTFNYNIARQFLVKCQLYKSGYWQRKYMDGATKAAQNRSFDNMMRTMRGELVSPRNVMYTKFRDALDDNLSEAGKAKFGLAASGLGMYFSTAAGGSVRIIVTDNRDSVIYYITDKRRNAKIGLVVMDTPAHAPLASSFGRWLLDLGEMEKKDDYTFGRAVLETLAMSSSKRANRLGDVGKSAYADYLGVMAIEDQRGVMFDNAGLKWGLNMTNATFCGLIVRALSHGEKRAGPVVDGVKWLDGREELNSKVLHRVGAGYELRPGEPSYFDTLNGAQNILTGGFKGGNDLQEGAGMRKLKQLTTQWLKERHPEVVERVVKAFAKVAPLSQISQPSRAEADIFHLMSDYFYEPEMAKVTRSQARELVYAGLGVLRKVRRESKDLEAFILAQPDVSKSDAWAPRASGY